MMTKKPYRPIVDMSLEEVSELKEIILDYRDRHPQMPSGGWVPMTTDIVVHFLFDYYDNDLFPVICYDADYRIEAVSSNSNHNAQLIDLLSGSLEVGLDQPSGDLSIIGASNVYAQFIHVGYRFAHPGDRYKFYHLPGSMLKYASIDWHYFAFDDLLVIGSDPQDTDLDCFNNYVLNCFNRVNKKFDKEKEIILFKTTDPPLSVPFTISTLISRRLLDRLNIITNGRTPLFIPDPDIYDWGIEIS